VVNLHFLARADIELLGDERLRNVPGKWCVTLEGCDGLEGPTFVIVAVLIRAAQREGGNLVQKEIEAMIVINDDGHVRLLLAQPGLGVRAVGVLSVEHVSARDVVVVVLGPGHCRITLYSVSPENLN